MKRLTPQGANHKYKYTTKVSLPIDQVFYSAYTTITDLKETTAPAQNRGMSDSESDMESVEEDLHTENQEEQDEPEEQVELETEDHQEYSEEFNYEELACVAISRRSTKSLKVDFTSKGTTKKVKKFVNLEPDIISDDWGALCSGVL